MRGFRDEDNDRRFRGGDDEREPVTIPDVVADRETAKALLCVIPTGKRSKEVWVPKSQIHDDSEVYKPGDNGKLIITGWWAEKEGLG